MSENPTTEQLRDPIVLYGIELRNANKRKAENAKDDCGCQQLISPRHTDSSKMKKKVQIQPQSAGSLNELKAHKIQAFMQQNKRR